MGVELEVFDMKFLRKVLRTRLMQRIMNRDIRGICKNKISFLERVDLSLVIWLE